MKEFILFNGMAVAYILSFVFLVFIGIKSKKTWVKQVVYNTSAVFLVIFIYELYLGRAKERPQLKGTYIMNYFGDHDLLGYGPSEDSMYVTSQKTFKGEEIYDVAYSIRDRIRYTPNTNDTSNKYALFFGGSFMFGEGLMDTQTIPYYFNEFNNREYQVRNFGFHGYGLHQAYAIADEVILKDEAILNADSVIAVYLFIPDHVRRAAGYTSWDRKGPKYEVENGQVVSKGKFEKDANVVAENNFARKVLSIWYNSNIYQRHFKERLEVTEGDKERAFEMFKSMSDKFKAEGIKFVILSESWTEYPELRDALRINGITNYGVTQMISDIKENREKYYLKGDAHPEALHNEVIGEFLSKLKE